MQCFSTIDVVTTQPCEASDYRFRSLMNKSERPTDREANSKSMKMSKWDFMLNCLHLSGRQNKKVKTTRNGKQGYGKWWR